MKGFGTKGWRKKCSAVGPALVVMLWVLAFTVPVPGAAQVAIFGDGFESGDLAAWDETVGLPPQPFRVSTLELRDPHLFVDVPLAGCSDFTDQPLPFGLGPSFNEGVATALTTDGDLDGFLDLSQLLLFRPLDLDPAVRPRVELVGGMCTAPLATTVCAPDPMTTAELVRYSNVAAGSCLGAVPGTTSGYSPAVTAPPAPCLVTDAAEVTLTLNGVTVPLRDVQVAGTPGMAPVTELSPGMMRGFLTEADAANILLPATLPLVGGQPLLILLPGGLGNCAAGDDRDTAGGETGWWFYFELTANEVDYIGA